MMEDRPDFAAILAFFKEDKTRGLVARQHALLKRVATKCAGGLTLRELPIVAELLELAPARVAELGDTDEASELEKTVCHVIRICGKAAIREKSNEELLAPGLAAAGTILARLVELVSSSSPRVAIEATRALHVVALGGAAPGEPPAAAAATRLNRRLLLQARGVEGAVFKLRGVVDELLAVDDDGTEQRVKDATRAVDADSDGEDGAPRRAAPRATSRGRAAPFSEVLTFSTKLRTVPFAASQLVLALTKLLRELSTSADAAFALVRSGGMPVCVKVLRLYVLPCGYGSDEKSRRGRGRSPE